LSTLLLLVVVAVVQTMQAAAVPVDSEQAH
jgi:hypothetical protein